MSTTKQKLSLEQQIQRLNDIREIENLMAKHVYYHALLKNKEELLDLWVRETPEPHFAQNQGYYVGYESLMHYYGELNIKMQWEQLKALNKVYPEVEVKEENLGAGAFQVHALTTSIIEVAGDGQTAKGIWYTPGAIAMVGPDGNARGSWIWERYGVDFAREDGEWKIWHLHCYTDFMSASNEDWAASKKDAPMGMGDDDGSGAPEGLPRPDREEVTYRTYTPKQVPQDLPRIPEPYYTFSETFSY
jgi:hypothetical protein